MHRDRIRAFVTTIGDYDVPVTIFAPGQYLRFVNTNAGVMTTTLGPGTTVVNRLATWGDTTGTSLLHTTVSLDGAGNMTDLVTLDGQDAPNITAKIGSDPQVNEITVWASNTAPWKLGRRIVTVNTTGDVDNVNTLNGRSPGILVGRSPTSAPSTNSVMVSADGTGIVAKGTPVAIDDFGNITGVSNINGLAPGDWVQGPASSTDRAIATWNGTDGRSLRNTAITILGGQVAGVTFVNSVGFGENSISNVSTLNGLNPADFVLSPGTSVDNRIARFDGTTGKLIRSSGVTLDDSGNISGVGTLNGQPAGSFMVGAASSTAGSLVTYADTSGKLASNGATVTASGGALSNVSTINGTDPSTWVVGPGSSTDNRVARFDGTTGKLIQQSPVLLDDAGNFSSAGTFNGVNVAGHNARHLPGGADDLTNTNNWQSGDSLTWNGSGSLYRPKWSTVQSMSSLVVGGSFVSPSNSSIQLPNRNGPYRVEWRYAVVLGDSSANFDVNVSWTGGSGTWVLLANGSGAFSSNGSALTGNAGGLVSTVVMHITVVLSTASSSFVTMELRSGGSSFSVVSGGLACAMEN